MAIPGKLDVTLKINQLPQAKPALYSLEISKNPVKALSLPSG